MRISVDKDKCITAGQCVLVAPEVFDQDDDGIVELLTDAPAEHLHEATREAAGLCPARLIEISE